MLKHLWIPILLIGLGGTAGLIRTMRANLLDELKKPYVETARSKGLPEWRLLLKYPVRHALNPFISTIGWILPSLVAGEVVVSIVLNLPTSGPVLFNALKAQDMYVAAGFILLLSVLTVIGTFVSDILLAILDPRIRLQ
jgi:peptide/nickel transport system permease protein